MSIDHLFTRIDTQAIYPPLMRAARDMIAALEAKGHVYYAISGHRDVAHQNELYAKGRTTRGPRVTNARGGQSYHNFGLAIDFCYDINASKPGLQPSWVASDYDMLGVFAQMQGLEWGGDFKSFKDLPHVQWPLAPHSLAIVRHWYSEGGISTAWQGLDAGRIP